jgi:dTMP kinase
LSTAAPLALTWLHPELGALGASPFELAQRCPSAPTLFARAGSVEALPLAPCDMTDGTWLLPVHDPQRLGELLAVVRGLAAQRAGAPLPLPFFAGPAQGEGTTRLLPVYRGLLPGDGYDARLRAATRELVRLSCPARALLFRALEHYALAGIEFAPPPPAPAPSPRALVVAIEGIDGAGKSSHVAALAEHARASGLAPRALKVFRHGLFHRTVTDLVRACHGERALHLWRLERLIKVADSLKFWHAEVETALAGCELALFDRYVSTHLAAATGRLHADPGVRALLACYPDPARVYLLDLDVPTALARLGARAERTLDENATMLERYRRALLAQARRGGWTVLDARAPFEANQAFLRADLAALVGERRR